jgi:ABC-2 type transport system permease protein
MMTDLLTVMWKERKGLFRHRGSRTQAGLTLLIPVALFGIIMPWQEASGWFESPLPLIASVVIPLLLVGITIPESFAGERERHTLETLLASPLSDRAILLGKIAVPVSLAWGMVLLTLLVSSVIVNIAHWDGQVMFYTPTILLANVVLSFLVATLSASAGVLISLRAATAREAQQTLMAATMFPLLILGVLLTLLLPNERIKEVLGTIDFTQVMLIVAAVLVVANIVLLLGAMARFKRARLILD